MRWVPLVIVLLVVLVAVCWGSYPRGRRWWW
jgi:hypothetical protein